MWFLCLFNSNQDLYLYKMQVFCDEWKCLFYGSFWVNSFHSQINGILFEWIEIKEIRINKSLYGIVLKVNEWIGTFSNGGLD